MSNLVTFPIVVGNGEIEYNIGNETTVSGTSAAMPVFALWGTTDIIGSSSNTFPVTDATVSSELTTLISNQTTSQALINTNLGSVIAELVVIATELTGSGAALTYTISNNSTVTTSGITLVGTGVVTESLTISTLPNSTANVWLNPTGGVPAINSGIPVINGGGSVIFGPGGLPLPKNAITAITDGSSSQVVTLIGG